MMSTTLDRLCGPSAACALPLRLALAAGLAAAGGVPALAMQPPDYHTIVVSGQGAPDSPAGVTFEFLSSPRINGRGDIAFWARLGGPAAADPKVGSIWTATLGGALSRVVRGGDQTPFDAAFRFIAPIDPGLDAGGGVTFLSSFSDVPAPTHFTPAPAGLFAGAKGGATADFASRDGAPSPYPVAVGNPTFTNVLTATTGPGGGVTFYGGIGLTPVVGHGIWAATVAGGPVAVAARNQQAPGLAEGVLYSYVDAPAQGAPGSLLFRATLQGGGTVVNRDQSLWTDRTGEMVLLAQHGEAAAGAPAGVTFADFGTRPVLNAAAHAVFAAKVEGVSVDAGNDRGLWTDRGGALGVLVREGDAAPGLGAGAVFSAISARPAVNEASDVAFLAHVRDGGVTAMDNSGIWLARAGEGAQLVVREGDQVGGMGAGVRYAVLHEPAINRRGQLAFLSRLRGDKGAGVTTTSNFALVVSDRCGRETPIARTGDSLSFTAPGGEEVTRTIADIVFDTGSPDAGRGQFNDGGTLVFTLRFTDASSGLFAATAYVRTDIDRSGAVNSNDISAFVTVWLASVTGGTLEGDFNGDLVVSLTDLADFVAAWLAEVSGGC